MSTTHDRKAATDRYDSGGSSSDSSRQPGSTSPEPQRWPASAWAAVAMTAAELDDALSSPGLQAWQNAVAALP
jgi:hypothetical protein